MENTNSGTDNDPNSLPQTKTGLRSRVASVIATMKRRPARLYILIGVLIAGLLAGSMIWWNNNRPEPKPQPVTYAVTKPKPPEKPKFFSPLTGVEVVDEAATKRQVTAIMIENSTDARPQSGLKQAGIVYEAIAEGGITRFLALYQEDRPGLIGPVRSLRPYFVEWAAGYDAAVVHIGGSARALEMIRTGNYGVDLDQFFNAGTFWRANDRAAPHNVYTTFDRLDALTAAKSKTSSSFTGFIRKNDAKLPSPTASAINIAISSGAYSVSYAYDPVANVYLRSQGGQPHIDREAGRIESKVVVALRVDNSTVMEDGYRQSYQVTGGGQAYIFQDGGVEQASWAKPDSKSPLQLLAADGKPITLNRGQTWITAVAPGKDVSWQ